MRKIRLITFANGNFDFDCVPSFKLELTYRHVIVYNSGLRDLTLPVDHLRGIEYKVE